MKTTIRAKLINLDPDQTALLDQMMLVFCTATRDAFKRLLEGVKPGPLEKDIAGRYGLNIRQAKDAVESARQIICSQQELLKMEVENLSKKVAAIRSRMAPGKRLSVKKKKALSLKLDKRQRKLDCLQHHLIAGTIPTVIFGGKALFIRRCKGLITREQWQDCRNNRFYSRGDKTKNGNPNLRVVFSEGNHFLEISTFEKAENNRAIKVRMPLYLPEKRSKKTGLVNGIPYKQHFLQHLQTGAAYQVEVIKRNQCYYAHITFERVLPDLIYTGHNGVIGIDTNPDGLALTMIDQHGNYRWHTYLKQHELTFTRSNRRVNLCGELAAKVMALAKENQCGLAVEDLKFKKDRDVTAKLARISHQFVYATLLSMLEQAGARNGVEVLKVRPQYTSKIGLYKYCHQYGMDVHNGAALVIARRSYRFEEAVPKMLKDKLIPKNKQDCFNQSNEWKQWSMIHKNLLEQGKDVKNPGFYLANRKHILGLVTPV